MQLYHLINKKSCSLKLICSRNTSRVSEVHSTSKALMKNCLTSFKIGLIQPIPRYKLSLFTIVMYWR